MSWRTVNGLQVVNSFRLTHTRHREESEEETELAETFLWISREWASASKEFQSGSTLDYRQNIEEIWSSHIPSWTPNGQVIRCHADQLKHNSFDPQIPLQQDADEQWLPPDTDLNQPHQEMTEHRHSARIRHPPVCFSPDNYWLLFLY